ncbi:MAG: hypothetical protein FJW31_24640 [Acidobacteria bacterium]|nr:hypothetical protein [Acidobacteriota bacterium]
MLEVGHIGPLGNRNAQGFPWIRLVVLFQTLPEFGCFNPDRGIEPRVVSGGLLVDFGSDDRFLDLRFPAGKRMLHYKREKSLQLRRVGKAQRAQDSPQLFKDGRIVDIHHKALKQMNSLRLANPPLTPWRGALPLFQYKSAVVRSDGL